MEQHTIPKEREESLYEYVMGRFRAGDISQRVVAQGAGVPFHTLTKIAQGRVKNPGVVTVQAIADYFKAVDAAPQCQCATRRRPVNPL